MSYGCSDWGPSLFHPDDAGLKEKMLAAGPACEVAGEEGDFWVLRFGRRRVRLRKRMMAGAVVPRPPFVWGDQARVKPPRTPRVGVVRWIGWRFKRRQHLFRIDEGGRPVKSRYVAEELARVHANPGTSFEDVQR